jgi:nitrate/TMAO reductase-like tetraheme cytochrome c subunit
MRDSQCHEEKNKPCEKKRRVCRVFIGLVGGFVFAVACFLLINIAMEPLSTSEYCGTACHEMQTAYDSWKLSGHAANEKGLETGCIDCHLISEDHYFRRLAAKGIAGAKDTYMHYFGPDYEVEKIRTKVLEEFGNERCIRCHKDLLAKPDSEMAKDAHKESLNPSDPEEAFRCVDCHEEAGHIRL